VKNNHEKVESLILQALRACNYDSVFSETKHCLNAALASLSKVGKKRSRHAASQKALEEGTNKHRAWWEMLKKNAANNIDLGWVDDE